MRGATPGARFGLSLAHVALHPHAHERSINGMVWHALEGMLEHRHAKTELTATTQAVERETLYAHLDTQTIVRFDAGKDVWQCWLAVCAGPPT